MNNMLSACGDYKELESIRDYIRSKANDAGLTEDKVNNITLAVDEACSNLIHYSMNFDKNQLLNIYAKSENNKFIVTIQDKGKSFDPLNVQNPNMEKYFKEMKHGGLGIFIIKKIVDNIEYVPADDINKFNSLILTMNF